MASCDPIEVLCQHAHRLSYEDLPGITVAHQKRRMLDNLATLLAGLREPGSTQYLELVVKEGCRPQATVLGHGHRTSLRNAATTNSIMARALDYCDVLVPGYHPSSTDVPVALGVAEAYGRSGGEVIAALAAGQDVAQRINLAAHATGYMYHGFDPNILGNLSAAIIASRLMGSTAEQLRHAVGLAFSAGTATMQTYQDKVLGVRIAQGNATRNGLEAALLAAAGVTGVQEVLKGENGFYNRYAQRAPDWAVLTENLGSEFRGERETCFKPYPCCGVLMALVDGGLAITAEHGKFAPDRIKSIEVLMSSTARLLCGQPFEPRESPQSSAMFSVQYVIASVLLRGSCRLEHFQPARILEPDVLALAARVSMIDAPAERSEERRFDAFDITVSLADDTTISANASVGSGWPENPLTDQALERKLIECLEFSGFEEAAGRAARISEHVMSLERMLTVAPLISDCV